MLKGRLLINLECEIYRKCICEVLQHFFTCDLDWSEEGGLKTIFRIAKGVWCSGRVIGSERGSRFIWWNGLWIYRLITTFRNVSTVFGGAAAPLSWRKRDYFSLSLDSRNTDAMVHFHAWRANRRHPGGEEEPIRREDGVINKVSTFFLSF